MFRNLILSAIVMIGFAAHADKYEVDPAHSSVVFKINHMGFSHVYGMFSDVSGQFEFDDKKPEATKLDITVKAESVNTMMGKRDDHLRKPDFFDAKQFPTITLKSDSVKKAGGNSMEVKGKLTMHGVTKPVTFTLTHGRVGEDPMKKVKTGGDAMLKIKRSDFGMNFMQGPNMVGDDVEIWVSLEGFKS